MRYITVELLDSVNPCPGGRAQYLRTFGRGRVELTEENFLRAQKANLDISFLNVMLEPDIRDAYKSQTSVFEEDCYNSGGKCTCRPVSDRLLFELLQAA